MRIYFTARMGVCVTTHVKLTIKLALYEMELTTNPPIDQISIENDKFTKQIKKYGRRNNSKHKTNAGADV
jgi:antitoxin component of RelBE/YafQ-DinJ toxin-antitoxin module